MQFNRKTNKKKQRIIFISVLAAVIAALSVCTVFLSRALTEIEPTTQIPPEKLPILPEEGRYNSYPIAYPAVSESDITIISIENENGSYFMAIPPSGAGKSFEFYYDGDEEGNYTYYNPDILSKEDDMEYDELYAVVKGDGYDRIPMLTYLVSAIGAPYFDYRIYLSDDAEKRDAELLNYGLSPETDSTEATSSVKRIIHFWYTKEDGSTGEYVIEIGAHTVTGSGYYFRIGDSVVTEVDTDGDGIPDKKESKIVYRDYIYVTGETNYFKYALAGIEAYINPVLIASGLINDKHAAYAPYLTPDYRQWKSEIHKLGSLPSDKEGMANVTDIFATVDAYMPVYFYDDDEDINVNGTVDKMELGSYILNLTEHTDNKLYPYLISALSGKEIGASLMQSLLYEKNVKEGAKYRYTVTDVESVITSAGEINTLGTPVGDNRYIRVTYILSEYNSETGTYERVKNVTKLTTDEDGKTKLEYASIPEQGIFDLEYLKKIGVAEEKINELLTVGDVGLVDIDVTYTKKNETGENSGISYKNMTYTLDSVLEIYEPEYDKDGKLISYKRVNEISDTSLVAYRYYYVFEGKAKNAKIGYINMASDENEADHEKMDKIRAAIKKWDKLLQKTSVEILKENIYVDISSDFILYSIKDISGYMTGEIVSAFRFVNVSERDPFYGESFYERTDDFMLYAMNQDACDKVVRLLGGLTDSSANGLSGMETVKVGITPESIEEYGCYANILRYSLPRELYVSNETAEDEYDDYGWLRTLDFVLYISESVWDPDTESWVKYVASEMYNIIAKVDAKVFGFIDLDMIDFWARRSLILVDSRSLSRFNIEFMMDDLQGKYSFHLNHEFGDIGSATDYDWIDVDVFKTGTSNFETKIDEYIEYNSNLPVGDKDKETVATLGGFYDYLAGKPVSADGDSRGTGMFKEFLRVLYFTSYMGTLTEEEQASALESGPLMRFSIKLDDEYDPNANIKREYFYEFYRCDDSRVMVRIYEKEGGAIVGSKYATDFYITSFAFEKIVRNFIGLLNGEILDANDPYPDYEPL